MFDSLTDFFNNIGNFFNDIYYNLIDFCWELLNILLDFLFGWINIPPFPEDLENNINNFLDLIFNNLQFLSFFIRPTTLSIVIPLIIFLFNFKYIYKLILWICRKLPFLGIE